MKDYMTSPKSHVGFCDMILSHLPLVGSWILAVFFCLDFLSALPSYLPIDDSYIIMAYARNVVEHGDFFSYNHGTPSTGITSPLYCLSIALCKLFFAGETGYVSAVRLVGFVSFLVSLVSGSIWVWFISGKGCRGHFSAVLFSVFWGCWGYIHFFAFCGMEPILYIALVMMALCLFVKGHDFLAGCILGASALCRPEAVFMGFLFGLEVACGFVRGLLKKDPSLAKRKLMAGLCLAFGFFIVYGVWLFRCLVVSGTIFPSTVTMKTHGAVDWNQVWNYARCFLTMRTHGSWEYNLVGMSETAWMTLRSWCPVALASVLAIIVVRKNPRYWLPMLYPVVHFVFTFSKNCSCGDNMRYHVLDFTLVLASVAVFFAGIIVTTRKKWGVRIVASISGVFLSVILCWLVISDAKYQLRLFTNMAAHFNILDYSIGRWLKSNTPPDTVVALYQAGGIKFFGQREIIDGGGVTDHTMFPYLKGPKNLLWAIVERKADYIASFGDEWLSGYGLHMRDRRFFTPVNIRCRGLYKVNKEALKAYADSCYQEGQL